MYQQPEYVYRTHPINKPKLKSEMAFVLAQLEGMVFYTRDFLRVYQEYLNASGRPLQDHRGIRSKLTYHYQRRFLIRRKTWMIDGWVEYINKDFERPVDLSAIDNSQALANTYDLPQLEVNPQIQTSNLTAEQEAEIQRIVNAMEPSKNTSSDKVQQQVEDIKSHVQEQDEFLASIGYGSGSASASANKQKE